LFAFFQLLFKASSPLLAQLAASWVVKLLQSRVEKMQEKVRAVAQSRQKAGQQPDPAPSAAEGNGGQAP
jgi:hypothetical protein